VTSLKTRHPCFALARRPFLRKGSLVKWSFQIARIAGIDVRIHATFLLLLAWLGLGYYESGGLGAVVAGLGFILLLFACVVLHEFGHALAARAYGIHTPDITLLPIGGVARLERMPEKPSQELVVALAGPAVNVVIAFGLYIVLGKFFDLGDLTSVEDQRGNMLTKLLAINVMLVVFNLIPAFPMDGGRILRALLATRIKHARATRIAAGIGQALAVLLGILGLLGNPLLLFIAVFVFFGAQQEAAYATLKESMEETRVGQVMESPPPLLNPSMTVLEAARVAMGQPASAYPLVDAQLKLLGMVPATDLAAAMAQEGGFGASRLSRRDYTPLPAEMSVAAARAQAMSSIHDVLPVINAEGQLVGVVWRRDLVPDMARGTPPAPRPV
jgi:Zn-dependent protease/CBS domain-containing protein